MFVIVIPTLNPDLKLTALVESLLFYNLSIVIVNDGSFKRESIQIITDIQSRFGTVITILHHEKNLGKGGALKTAFSFLASVHPGSAAITVDSDGQHTIKDIMKIVNKSRQYPHALIIGERERNHAVPFKSRFGNSVTSILFRYWVKCPLKDTQHGLRAIPSELLPELIAISGQRYDYETAVLLFALRKDIQLKPVPTKTIYFDHNKSSYFRPVSDSFSILRLVILFGWQRVWQNRIKNWQPGTNQIPTAGRKNDHQ